MLGVVAAAWLLWPRKPVSDVDRVRGVVAEVARLAGEKDVGGMLEHVGERYRGEPGDRNALRQLLVVTLRRADWVSVIPARLEVAVAGDRAKASFVALLLRGPAKSEGEVRPEELAGSYAFEVEFERAGDRWLAIDARRRDARAGDWLQ